MGVFFISFLCGLGLSRLDEVAYWALVVERMLRQREAALWPVFLETLVSHTFLGVLSLASFS